MSPVGTVVTVTPRPRRAVCPGSYDPVTSGHLDVIERAAALHDELVVVVLHNPGKAGTFTVEERIGFVERALAGRGVANVRVEAFAQRLLVDVCRELGADVGWHLPSRFAEGYGLSLEALEAIAAQGYGLVLTVDCGITAVDAVAGAKALGLDVVISDHHRAGGDLPGHVLAAPLLLEALLDVLVLTLALLAPGLLRHDSS